MTSSTIRAVLPYAVQRVWAVVLDVPNYCAWRSDLSRAEMVSETRFIEYTREGYPTTFTVTAVEPCRKWAFDVENTNLRGCWTGLFSERADGTELVFTETVAVKKILMRPFVKSFLKKQQARFMADLEGYLSGHVGARN